MHEKLLKECGLTQNETAAYLALLRIGKATSSVIVREAKISGGKIYETLNKLIEKGLVKTFSENGIKQFVPSEPSMLIDYIREKERSLLEKEKELERIIPQLSDLRGLHEPFETVELMKGLRATREIVFNALGGAKKIRIMGVRSSKELRYNNFWKEWHKERVRLRKKAQLIFSDKNTDYWKFFDKLPYTEIRSISHFSPAAMMILDEHVFFFSYEEDLTCIHLYSKSISKSFDVFFDDLWGIAVKG